MLTKSDVMSYLQCPRKLWLEHHLPGADSLKDSSQERRARDGHLVGEQARQALGAGTIWPMGSDNKEDAARTALEQLLSRPDKAFVEMPMVAQGLYVRADALIPHEDGGYTLQETKSSTFPLKKDKITPDKAPEHYLDDLTLQAWVMEQAGIPMPRAELNLLNSKWRYNGADYKGLFRPMDLTAEVEERKQRVPMWLKDASRTLAGGLPDVCTGAQCSKPNGCQFLQQCKELEPPAQEHPIELLPDSAGKSLAKKLRLEHGYESLLEPAAEELVGANAALYRRIQEAHKTGNAILEPGTDKIMSSLKYPRYYFDFEGIDLPVPRWEGIRPYEQIPFQWSCHIERAPGVFEHRAFLDLTGNDPSIACIEKMREVLDPDDQGPILVFFKTYEKGRLEGFAERHPQYTGLMENYISRLVDLHPLVKNYFYDPRMKGSFSIKKVLPVIAPDLDYSELEGVQEGTGAQIAYLNYCFELGLASDIRAELKKNMLSYCEQDTWAMVEIGYFLELLERPGPNRPAPDTVADWSPTPEQLLEIQARADAYATEKAAEEAANALACAPVLV